MKTALKHKKIITGTGLLCLALGCAAATLGRAQGSVWIGKPLDLAIPVQFADGEDASAACVDADVFHADARQDTSRIRITVEPSGSPQAGVVRIVSSAPVDEPMVTVYLRAGCLQKNSRRYVLLAELPSDVATPAPVPSRLAVVPLAARADSPLPAAPATSTPQPGTSPARLERKVPQGSGNVQTPQPLQVIPSTPVPVRVSKKIAPPVSARLARVPGKSRLTLDILDLMEERGPTLKSSTELSILPTEDLQRRSEAAALWRAVNAAPEDILREAGRVQVMQADVDALQTLTAKNQRSLAELGARLQKAEAERYANWLVYVLLAMLLAMVLALVLLWRRRVIPDDNDPVQWHAGTPATPLSAKLDLDLDVPAPNK